MQKANTDYFAVPCTVNPGEKAKFIVSVFSEHPATITALKPMAPPAVTIKGLWDGRAGNSTSPLYLNNPIYQLKFKQPGVYSVVLSQIKPSKQAKINLKVVKNRTESNTLLPNFDEVAESKREGFQYAASNDNSCELEISKENVDTTFYAIPSASEENYKGKFSILVIPNDPRVPSEDIELSALTGVDIKVTSISSQWKGPSAGGCRNHKSWINNPRVALKISNPTVATYVQLFSPPPPPPLPLPSF